tara:strand:- start:1274 stop:1960 length:687 start_codon:yes stop_codon:yes gene_type:complete
MSPLSSIKHLTNFDTVQHDLEQLGLTKAVFEAAINGGLFYYKRTTDFHPVTTAGSRFWEEVVAELRRALITPKNSKWAFKHEKGLSITFLPESGLSIVVTSGNVNTGIMDSINIRTKNAKGPSTLDYVGRNGDLFFDELDLEVSKVKSDSHETWVLLYYIDKKKQEVRSELSLPSAIHQVDGKIVIDRWEKRIVLPTISFFSMIDSDHHGEKQQFSDDIDFEKLIQNE